MFSIVKARSKLTCLSGFLKSFRFVYLTLVALLNIQAERLKRCALENVARSLFILSGCLLTLAKLLNIQTERLKPSALEKARRSFSLSNSYSSFHFVLKYMHVCSKSIELFPFFLQHCLSVYLYRKSFKVRSQIVLCMYASSNTIYTRSHSFPFEGRGRQNCSLLRNFYIL